MEEYGWLHYDSFVPKANTLLVPISKSTLQYDHIDTLNSKLHPLVMILSHNREEQKYLAPPVYIFIPK